MIILTGALAIAFLIQLITMKNLKKERDYYRERITKIIVKSKGSRGLFDLQRSIVEDLGKEK